MNFIDLSYHHSSNQTYPPSLLNDHYHNNGYVYNLPEGCRVSVIKFLNYSGTLTKQNVHYQFFRGHNSRFWIPFAAHQHIYKSAPEVILLHGLKFPIQVIALRKKLGKKVKLIVQHHADRPGSFISRTIQKKADEAIDAYFFSDEKLASPWITKKIINQTKVHTVTAGSSSFKKISKDVARSVTGVKGSEVFLWVGRLNANKDPFTVIKAFSNFINLEQDAKLYMIYKTAEMLQEVEQLIRKTKSEKNIFLISQRQYAEMELWYNSADFFISSSHSESYGFAAVEAISCGCIPIVTNIPSLKKFCSNGTEFLFSPGDEKALFKIFSQLQSIDKAKASEEVIQHFQKKFSFKRMADEIYSTCKKLI